MDTGKKTKPIGSIITLLLSCGLIGLVYWQRFWIQDQIRLWHYQPPAAVIQLADETKMSSATRRTFYANHPLLEDKEAFAADCKTTEQTIVLGCYVSRKGIFLYTVSDSRLDGVEQVTAAHEVLHAEYERLSPSKRKQIDQLTSQAYNSVTDSRIRDTIQAYKDNGADVANELHSILGTEVRNLPPALEAYYAKYFSNRGAVVDSSEKYQAEFTKRQQEVDQADAKLKQMKPQIDSQLATLTAQSAQLTTQYQQLNSLRTAEKVEQYNAGVSPYNAAVARYNASVNATQVLIDSYNAIVKERNDIALEENQLSQAIDSRPAAITSQ